jgi:hypothetical protein
MLRFCALPYGGSIDPAKNDRAKAEDSVSGSRKARVRHLGFRQAPEDDRRDVGSCETALRASRKYFDLITV